MIVCSLRSKIFPYTTLFRSSSVETVIENVLSINQDAVIIIKSTIPVGYTKEVREKFGTENIIFRSEEHTSELQSRGHLVCRLLLEKNKIFDLLLLSLSTRTS